MKMYNLVKSLVKVSDEEDKLRYDKHLNIGSWFI